VSKIIALSLSHSPVRHRADALHRLAERLLDLLVEHAPDDVTVNTAAFRSQLTARRDELRYEEDADRVTALTSAIADDCADFLDRTRSYHSDREGELAELVQVLREAVEAVRGHSLTFEKALLRSTTEMGRMVQIDDIRELKRALADEVETIRTAVAERQKNEAKHFETLTTRVQSLEQSLVKARAEAATDALTQLPNRGAFDLAVREWVARAAHTGRVFTVAMVDLDDFKRINDTYGHPVGDRVITTMAQLLRGAVGEGEFASRFGGEEFALLLTAGSASKARERLMALLDGLPPSFEYQEGGQRRFVSFSFSAGVTAWVAGDTPESIVKRADEALYDAKRRGKKRVETRPGSFLRGLMG
jgi:diguanylate cyclase